jgi:hypothetical protein
MEEKQSRKKRILRHISNVGMAIISVSLMTSPALAVDPVEVAGVIGVEGGTIAGKKALNVALEAARSKPAMSTATCIVCIACLPVAGAVASPGLCIACGILIAKTFG